MLKKIVILLVVLIVVVGAGSFFYLDSIVKNGVEVVGSRVLGTGVTVSSVSLSPFNGEGNISDLRIENPEGFKSDYIFELGYVAVNINTSSVFSDVVEIQSITIAQPIITYETRITTDNIRSLLANIPGSAGDAATDETANGTSKKIIIREIQILDAQLNLSAGIASAPVRLPDIILHDIGNDDEAATVSEALTEVLTALRRSVTQADLPSLDVIRDSVESSVRDSAEKVEEKVEDLSNRVRGLLN